jgi:hypothetical protein
MLDDGDYELVLGQDQGFFEDPINVAENLTEAKNQVRKSLTSLPPPPLKKASPDVYPSIFKYCNLIIILYILHYI